MDFFKKFLQSFTEGFALWRKAKNHAALLEVLRFRIILSSVCGVFLFSVVAYRLADIMIIKNYQKNTSSVTSARSDSESLPRADVFDSNGAILATSLKTASCYINPSVVLDVDETISKLAKIPGMPNAEKIKEKISNKEKVFVWLARHVTPKIQQEILDLGLPGVHFKKDYKRVYTYGNLFSHIIGACDIDGDGLSGLEKGLNQTLMTDPGQSVTLSLDTRIQSIVHQELLDAVSTFRAEGANAIVMHKSGEIISMVSLPDFDPNNLSSSESKNMFNRNTLGVFEPGSTFKILNVAIALESGTANLNTKFDASAPVKIGRFTVSDFRGKNRTLTLAEAFVFSSNIASIKIAKTFGPEVQKNFFKKLGVFDRVSLEIPEVGYPIYQKRWTEPTFMTASYGYGVAVSPMQLVCAVSTIVNNGKIPQPTFIKGYRGSNSNDRFISENTSKWVRELMKATVMFGTAKKAAVDGVQILGKTGTAYKINSKGYGNNSNRSRIATFIGGFPADNPEYIIVVMLDNPKSTEHTYGYATAGWNSAPTAGKILNRITPLLVKKEELKPNKELLVTKYLKLD